MLAADTLLCRCVLLLLLLQCVSDMANTYHGSGKAR